MNKDMEDREEALKWWNNYKWLVQNELSNIYYNGKYYESLTDEEIEYIWRQENNK